MKFIKFLLDLFTAPPSGEPQTAWRRLKWVEGTEWTCPETGELIGVAKCDIYSGDPAVSSRWEIADVSAFFGFGFKGRQRAMRSHAGRVQFHTPTGWVG